MRDIPRETADDYQEFFNFLNKEHNLKLTISEMDELIFEAQKLVKKLSLGVVSQRSEKLVICKKCGNRNMYQHTKTLDKCEDCNHTQNC